MRSDYVRDDSGDVGNDDYASDDGAAANGVGTASVAGWAIVGVCDGVRRANRSLCRGRVGLAASNHGRPRVGGGRQRVLTRGSDFPMDPSWSPDSTRILWHAYPNNLMPWDQSALVVADIQGGAPRTITSAARTAYAQARFSPNGQRIVCVCDRTGSL